MNLALMDQPGLVTGQAAEVSISNGQICLDGLPVIDKAFGPRWYQITLICEGATYYAYLSDWNAAVDALREGEATR
jgi:hypothetical protein